VLDIVATPNSNDAARTKPPILCSKFFPFMIASFFLSGVALPTPDVETRAALI
jgi:hypothetical protein